MDDVDCTHTPHALTRKLTPLYPTVQFIEQMSQVASTGGKRLSGRIRQGNRWAKTVLVQAAQAAARSKHTYLGALANRLRQCLGAKRATIAVAHRIVLTFYQMMTTRQPYQEKGAEFLMRRDAEQIEHRLVKQLERLGHQVILLPTAAGNA
jgi:transposase